MDYGFLTTLKIIGALFGAGTLAAIGALIRLFFEKRGIKASAIKVEAEAGAIVITGQRSLVESATEVANQFGENVKLLLEQAQIAQRRYEELLDRYTAQLSEAAQLKAEVQHLTHENIRLVTEVERLRAENLNLGLRVTALENK